MFYDLKAPHINSIELIVIFNSIECHKTQFNG